MNEDQIKHMVERFLGWELPKNFCPDGGVLFQPFGDYGTSHQFENKPTGTNLLDAVQATAMVRYMIEGFDAPGIAVKPMSAPVKSCAACRFNGMVAAYPYATDATPYGLECRRRAPVATGGTMSSHVAVWPIVKADDCCGEFEP